MDFDSVEELYSYVQNQMLLGAKEVGEEIKEMLRDYIDVMWYQAHTPIDYKRTMDFINSISVKNPILINNTISVEVYFDEDKINASETESGWNQHMSMSKEDVSSKIPDYIESGNNSSVYSYEGIHMTERVKEKCMSENIPVQLMVTYLNANGIECTD